jgi:hypothetical protein
MRQANNPPTVVRFFARLGRSEENMKGNAQARPVIAVEDAIRVELEAIAWRYGLKRK